MAESTRQLKDPVYDPDNEKPVTKPDLAQKENVSSVPAEQLERIPNMSDEEGAALAEKRGPITRKDLANKEQGTIHENPVGSGYREIIGNKLNNSKRVRNYVIASGVLATIVTVILVILSFLNVFKLDGLMSNIEQKAFLRNNASINTRSSKWISAYVEARMMDWGDNPDLNKNENTLFRSSRVDTNSPFTDWYKTLRASNFEQDVFEKHGIKFTSAVGSDGRPRLGKIDINGGKPIDVNIPNSDLDLIQKGDIKTLNKYQAFFDLDTFDSNKDARKAIKEVVNANTHWSEIYKRRFLRRSIQNMTGVKDWRFFETTRDKIDAKKIDIRNRVIQKMVPDTTLLGRVTRCLFGVDKCTPSDDVADPKEQVGNLTTELAPEDTTTTQAEKDAEAKLGRNFDEAAISDTLRNLLKSAGVINQIINIPSTLDMLANIDSGLKNLVKYVVIARGAQAAGLFQVFETSRDQIKTGQVSGEEVNAFMEGIDTAGSSAGWTQVISGDSKSPPGTTQSGGQCTEEAQALQEKDPTAYKKKYGDYAPLCADQQIGSADNAQKIQDAYDHSVGQVVGPIVTAWEKAKNNGFFGPIIGALEWFTNHIFNALGDIANAILNAIGLKDNVDRAVAWVFGKLSNFLGIAILKGYESAGTVFNWLVQGGAYLAESNNRQQGAALTNKNSQAAAQNNIALYEQDKNDTTSLYDKVASLDNPDSLAFKGAFALSNIESDPSGSAMASIHGVWSGLAHNLGSVFMPKLFAATPNGYAASQFAGIKTYDYPQECYNLDPITAKPLDGTNAIEVLSKPSAYGLNHAPFAISPDQQTALSSWDTERSSQKFYKLIYDIIGEKTDGGDILAEHIYNCNLLDTAVRGSLGYLYGYNADAADQVIDSAPATSSSTDSTGTPAGGTTPPSGTAQQLAKKILQAAAAGRIKFNVLNSADISDGSTPEQNIQETANGQPAKTTTTCDSLDRGAQPPVSSVALDPSLLQFILELSQAEIFQINALAGQCHSSTTSNHYLGKAVDFGCPFDPGPANTVGAKYNISDQTGEACSNSGHYHYSIGGN